MSGSGSPQQGCRCCGRRLAGDNRAALCSPCQRRVDVTATQAPQLPDEFWKRPELQAAFKQPEHRRFGAVVRAYRLALSGAVTQAHIAGWLELSQEQVSRIERGLSAVNDLPKLRQWTQALCVPKRYLWFKVSAQASDAYAEQEAGLSLPTASPFAASVEIGGTEDVDVSRLWVPRDTVEIICEFTRKDLMVDGCFTPNRREATRIVASVAFGSALLEPLERWLAGRPENPVVGRNGGIGLQEVGLIEDTALLFRGWDDEFGGGLRRKAVVGQLNEVADILRDSHQPAIAGRLFGAMAQLAETAAIMSWDSGRQALAQRYYVLALRASKSAGDPAFGANVMAGMARQLLYLDHAGDALELVRLAQESSAGYATFAVQAMLHTREAWAYAQQGRISAFRRATEKAEATLAKASSAEGPHWIGYFDAAELAGTTGGRLLKLAHEDRRLAGEAAEYIERAIAVRRPGRLRSSALDQIGLLEARLIQGELDEVSRLGHEAVEAVQQTPSARVHVMLTELYQRTGLHSRIPVIANLRDQIRAVLAS